MQSIIHGATTAGNASSLQRYERAGCGHAGGIAIIGVLRGARCSFGPLYRELRSSSDLDHSQTIALLDAVSNILAWNASSIGRPGPDQQHEVGDAHRPRSGRRKQLSLGCPGILLSGLPLSSWCLEMLREVQQPPWSQLCRSSTSPICRERRALCAATIGATITRAIFRL